MEMAEEGKSQDKVSRKLMKFHKVVEKGEEDRISALPDCLLLEILSRLPSTKYAIRTGALSKRWENIWNFLPILIFNCNRDNVAPLYFVSFVDKTLSQCRQLKLKKLQLLTLSGSQYYSQISNWIRYAISRNVEQLGLSFTPFFFPLDQNFFIGPCFSDLTLKCCNLNPTGAISWKNLKSLFIKCAVINEDLIENILSGSPLLETLDLNGCWGYKQLNITSKSVKNLVLSRYKPDEEVQNVIKINAPDILSLRICGKLGLWNVLLLNVSSLVEADLNYVNYDYFERISKEEEEEMLKGLILNLRHVKVLKIGSLCSKVVSRLEDKGFKFPSNIKFHGDAYDSDSD